MLFFIISLKFLIQFTAIPQPEFEPQTIDANISIGYGLALGDVDGDGKPDILLADKKQFVWYRNGDWKRFVMIENLTAHDNVCIAARDITGDGKVEVAVGAQWNPSETSDTAQSGSVHFLIRPDDPAQRWKAVELPHEPTIHRMRWIRSGGKYYLVVAPLHGRGNKDGSGEGVKVIAYEYPEDIYGQWRTFIIDDNMHLTHNFDFIESAQNGSAEIYLAGKEGIRVILNDLGKITESKAEILPGIDSGAGEVRVGKLSQDKKFIAAIEPMHGHDAVIYVRDSSTKRIVIDDNLKEGHALAVADLLGIGYDQVLAGWRVPDKDGKVGIKLYVKKDAEGKQWESYWVDENKMACEDIQVMDLDGDSKPDIIASGRATHNLKIYWNKSGQLK